MDAVHRFWSSGDASSGVFIYQTPHLRGASDVRRGSDSGRGHVRRRRGRCVVRALDRYFTGHGVGQARGILCDCIPALRDGSGIVCASMFRKSFFTAALWSLISSATVTLIYYMLFFLMTGRAGISALWLTALPEILYSTLLTPLVYFPVARIAREASENDA